MKKRSFRALWIQRINAAVRAEGLTYGQFIHALKLAGIDLDRKVLADIAMHEARSVQRDHRPGERRAGEEGGVSLLRLRDKEGRRERSRRPFSCAELIRRSPCQSAPLQGSWTIEQARNVSRVLSTLLERMNSGHYAVRLCHLRTAGRARELRSPVSNRRSS